MFMELVWLPRIILVVSLPLVYPASSTRFHKQLFWKKHIFLTSLEIYEGEMHFIFWKSDILVLLSNSIPLVSAPDWFNLDAAEQGDFANSENFDQKIEIRHQKMRGVRCVCQ